MNFLLLLCFFLSLVEVRPKTLTWKLSTSYDRSDNWSLKREPCSTDLVVFPNDIVLDLDLPRGVHKMRELALPANGELFFSEGASIVITGELRGDPACPSEGTNVWRKKAEDPWLDPNSWSGAPAAAPDEHRLPCSTDTVIFPPGSVFRLVLPYYDLSVAWVVINGEKLSGKAWDAYFEGPEGERQFAGMGRLTATGRECEEPAGCACENMEYCASVACDQPSCLRPVRLRGDCCLSCDAGVVLGLTDRTSLRKVQQKLEETLRDEGTSWHVSRSGDATLQVALRRNGGSQDLAAIASKINDALVHGNLGLVGVEMLVSGPYASDSFLKSPAFLFFFTLLLTAFIFGGTFYFYERDRLPLPSWLGGGGGSFMFARFENVSGVVEIRPNVMTSPLRSTKQPMGFDNPLYTVDKNGAGRRHSEGEDSSSSSDSSSSGDTSSYDRRTVTTLAAVVDEGTSLEEVPITTLIDP